MANLDTGKLSIEFCMTVYYHEVLITTIRFLANRPCELQFGRGAHPKQTLALPTPPDHLSHTKSARNCLYHFSESRGTMHFQPR